MNSGQQIYTTFTEQRELLIACNSTLKEIGRNLADADFNYHLEYTKEATRLHNEEGVGWSTCVLLAKGSENVATLRMQRDLQKYDYLACQEKINSLKIEIRILETEVNRELGVK